MADFISAMQGTLNDEFNYSVTENGAVGYRTTGKNLLDLNFAVSSLRRASAGEIIERFTKAFYEDKILAMKWLFFARDVREGLGERRLFRVVVEDLARNKPEYVFPLIEMIPEYGRYDDLWCLLDTDLKDKVLVQVKKWLEADCLAYREGENISLLAKWLPSVNATSPVTRRRAKTICKYLGLFERDYRKTLSALRDKLDVVERKMSSKDWNEIKYEAVPSRANLVYNDAFLRNDEERRREYLSNLSKGETKINASTLYPHDIVSKYMEHTYWNAHLGSYNETLEALWAALPDTVQGCGNTIVVADGSGSMLDKVGNSNVTALDVANALAIYFSERSSGQFKDKYITFSATPQLVDFSQANSLRDKLSIALTYNECADTDIEAVFNLILTTAIKNRMSQSDLPANILIISDMEFNGCAICDTVPLNSSEPGYWGARYQYSNVTPRLFEVIGKKYEDAGYKIPRLIFWNVNSRTMTIPVTQNECGVALVSGFSTNIAKMVMSGELDPYKCLLETLNAERYEPIAKALKWIGVYKPIQDEGGKEKC